MSVLSDLSAQLRRIIVRHANVQVRIANTALAPPVEVTAIVDDGAGTATVTAATHGYSTSDSVIIFGARESRFNGTFTVTVTDANTFTFAVSGTTAASANTAASISTVESVPAGLTTEVFYTLGDIADASVSFVEHVTKKTTAGKEHYKGANYTVKLTMLQTGDAEFTAIEELTQEYIDIAIFAKAAAAQVTNPGTIIENLEQGFLIYGQSLIIEGEVDLSGGESGIEVSFGFFLSKDPSEISIGA